MPSAKHVFQQEFWILQKNGLNFSKIEFFTKKIISKIDFFWIPKMSGCFIKLSKVEWIKVKNKELESWGW